MRAGHCALRFVCVLAVVLCAAGVVVGEGYSYRYFKEARELTLNPQKIAVLAPEGREAAVLAEPLAAAGFVSRGVAEHAVRGWAVAGLDGARGAAGLGLDAATEALLARGDVGFVSPVFVDEMGGDMFVTPHLLVRFADGVGADEAEKILAAHGVVDCGACGWGGMDGAYRARSGMRNGAAVLRAANKLAALDAVVFAEPDMVFTGRSGFTPNDPEFGNCWGHRNTGQFGGSVVGEDMDTDLAWDTTIGSALIIAVVIDTGVDQTHPDINQLGGQDFTSDSSTDGGPVNSFDNHGTPVAGCITAFVNNNEGAVGVAPACRSASARCFITISNMGNWTSVGSWTVNALDWADSIGARVTNNSNGYGFSSSAIASKYESTRSQGVRPMVHFASAGNDDSGPITYPATLASVNAVAALDPDGLKSGFSNVGPQMMYAAPGANVRTADRQGLDGYSSSNYAYVFGTSFASPYVAGIACLILSENNQLTAQQVEDIIANTARDKGPAGLDDTYGWGFVNAKNAIDQVTPPSPPGDFDLLGPVDGVGGVTGSLSFSWSNAARVLNYELLVDDDPAFGSPELSQTALLNSISLSTASLADGQRYFWTVLASNDVGSTGAQNGPFQFVTEGPLPGAPTIAAPTDGSDIDTPTADLLWVGGGNTLWYLLEVDDDPLFGSPEVSQQVDHTGGAQVLSVGSPDLAGGQTYHWRVTGRNWVGDTGSTPGSLSFNYLFGAACDGDANGDDVVDVNDISYVLFRLGGVCPPCEGDANGDSVVDVNDISYVLFRLGNPC